MAWCAACTSSLVEDVDDETVFCHECNAYRGRLS